MKKIFSILLLLAICFSINALCAEASKIVLTEDQANDTNTPIIVCQNSTITVSLQEEESYSLVYSSGSGSEHGYRWKFDGGTKSDVLVEGGENETYINHSSAPSTDERNHENWITKQMPHFWTFAANQAGLTTLTFKKYYYSNAKIQNIDGSSPWKDPVETIQFTINVVVNAATSKNSR